MMGTLLAALAGYTMFLAVDNTVGKVILSKRYSSLVNMLLLLPYIAIIAFLFTLVEG